MNDAKLLEEIRDLRMAIAEVRDKQIADSLVQGFYLVILVIIIGVLNMR